MRSFLHIFMFLFLIAAAGALVSCSNSDETNASPTGEFLGDFQMINQKEGVSTKFPFAIDGISQEVKVQLTPKSELPGWLAERINGWEEDDPMKSTAVYAGEWNRAPFYVVRCWLQQTVMGDQYDKDGEPLKAWSYENPESLKKFIMDSTNWKLIYCTDVYKYVDGL